MKTETRLVIGVGIALILGTTAPANAAEPQEVVCPICRFANDQQASYGQKMSSTLVRGASNVAFGWTELLLQPASEVKAGGHLVVGIGKGVGFALSRTAVGAGELLTFWMPKGKQGYVTFSKDCPVCMGKR